MSSLQQPSRSSPAPLGYGGRGNGEAQQFVYRPAVIGEPRSLSRGSFDPSPVLGGVASYQPQRAMRSAEVVDRPDQPHARLQRRSLTRRRTSPAHQRSQPRAKGGLQPLDIRGVDYRGGGALSRPQAGCHLGLHTSRTMRRTTPVTRRRAYRLIAWATMRPSGKRSFGRPRLPVRSGSRNTLKACLG
jgi:hypothetical protein